MTQFSFWWTIPFKELQHGRTEWKSVREKRDPLNRSVGNSEFSSVYFSLTQRDHSFAPGLFLQIASESQDSDSASNMLSTLSKPNTANLHHVESWTLKISTLCFQRTVFPKMNILSSCPSKLFICGTQKEIFRAEGEILLTPQHNIIKSAIWIIVIPQEDWATWGE